MVFFEKASEFAIKITRGARPGQRRRNHQRSETRCVVPLTDKAFGVVSPISPVIGRSRKLGSVCEKGQLHCGSNSPEINHEFHTNEHEPGNQESMKKGSDIPEEIAKVKLESVSPFKLACFCALADHQRAGFEKSHPVYLVAKFHKFWILSDCAVFQLLEDADKIRVLDWCFNWSIPVPVDSVPRGF